MSDQYDKGGYIPGPPTLQPVTLCADECLIRIKDGRPVCVRNHEVHDATFWASYPEEWRP